MIDWDIVKSCNLQAMNECDKYSFIACYETKGLKKYNHKELCIVIDIDYIKIIKILNSLGTRISNGDVITEGIRSDLGKFVIGKEADVQFVTIDNNDDTLYVIIPDSNGNLPMDNDCLDIYKDQYLYTEIISNLKNKL